MRDFFSIRSGTPSRAGPYWAQRQNLALSGIVAAQLPDHPPFAVHELAFLHVAEPYDRGPGVFGVKPIAIPGCGAK